MDTVKHKWNTRRCIKYSKYRTLEQARRATVFNHCYSTMAFHLITCPHCNTMHFVMSFRGKEDAQRILTELPPLFPITHADPLRSNGQTARENTKTLSHI